MATECIMMFLKQKDFPNRRKPHSIDVNSYFFHRDMKLCASLPNNSEHPPQHTTHTLPKPKPARAILGDGERTESGMKSKFKTIPDSQCNWNIQERVFIWSRIFKWGNDYFRVYLFQLSHWCLKWEANATSSKLLAPWPHLPAPLHLKIYSCLTCHTKRDLGQKYLAQLSTQISASRFKKTIFFSDNYVISPSRWKLWMFIMEDWESI